MKLKSLLSLAVAAMLAMPVMANAATYNMAVGDPEDSEQGYAANAFKNMLKKNPMAILKLKFSLALL